MSDKPIYRMSRIGDCPRALSAERLGYGSETVPEWLEKAAREGNRHEQWIKEDMRADGWEVLDCKVCPVCKEKLGDEREGVHVEIECDDFIAVGHMDGIINLPGNSTKMVLEIKSRSYHEFERWMKEKWEGFPNAAAQISCYMKGSGISNVAYYVKSRSSGYIDKQYFSEPPIEFRLIEDKIKIVEECVAKGELCNAEYDSSNILCKYCSYKGLCIPEVQISSVSESELLKAVEDWREGRKLVGDGERLQENAKKIFENHVKSSGIEKFRYSGLAVSNVNVKDSVLYDKGLLVERFGENELAFAAKKKYGYSYLRINDLNKEN